MSVILNKETTVTLPVLPLRGLVAFPNVQMNIEIVRPLSLAAFTTAATMHEMEILLVTQKDFAIDAPKADDLFEVGVLAKIKHVIKNPQNNLSVVFEGISRAKIISVDDSGSFMTATAEISPEGKYTANIQKIEALIAEIKNSLSGLAAIHPTYTDEMSSSAEAITDAGYFADFVASSALIDFGNKQSILELYTPKARLEKLLISLSEERMLLECEHDIQVQVREKIDRNQKDYFLREQVKAIQAELGEDEDEEILEYEQKIEEKNLSEEIKNKLLKELSKLAKTPFGAAEASVLRSYLDTCLEFPFGVKTVDETDISKVKNQLDLDHDGMDKVKERILEFVAVKRFSESLKNQTLCLVGPPGVGKTSIAASIAKALGRNYARVSLGGVHDEAEIRGHRKTYVGAMPGRIITAISNSGSHNPVIVLDEIDKLAGDFRGDPTSALLEVLDPEQNKFFRDNFIEFSIDLSDCIFIATANGYDRIPAPLLDRMEIIELSSYTDSEKLAIAKNHLVPKQMEKHGMTKKSFSITDSALMMLIKEYTRESGVRNLEREIASVIRKSAKLIVEGKVATAKINSKNLKTILGKTKVTQEKLEEKNIVGVVNGLAYTQTGGDLLKVEVAVMEGTGKIELTGSLGDVMKESARIAHSYVRTIASKYGISENFYKDKDIHIHFPEGAIPKDGPSAGITMVTAIVSALSSTPVKRDVAMTGEISLRGRILPIGGLKEKTLAAYRSGIKTVIIPKDNLKDLDDIDSEAKENLEFIPCENASEVLSLVLCRK